MTTRLHKARQRLAELGARLAPLRGQFAALRSQFAALRARVAPRSAQLASLCSQMGHRGSQVWLRLLQAVSRLWGAVRSRLRRHRAPSLVGHVITVQLIITAAIGILSLGGLAWTSRAITEQNLERWATQWTSQLNDLGAPLYVTDPESAVLGVERLLMAYPEISRVDWYSPDGLPMFAVTQDGYSSQASSGELPAELLVTLQAEGPDEEPRLLDDPATVDGHYRLVGPIWSESFSGDALMRLGSDPTPEITREIMGMVSVELDYSWYESVLANRLLLGSLALLIGLSISTACGRFILQRALRPLSRLQLPLSRLAAGDMDVEFQPSRHVEIQNIISTLQNTTKALGERDRRLSHLATHDSLTGLFNRHAFVQELTLEIARLGKTGKRSAILFVDLDQFKYINDTCGHPAGDELLRMAARSIRATTREQDLVARFGGDEFTIIARDVSRAQAVRIGKKIIDHMSMLTQVHKNKVFHLQCSIGITMVGATAMDPHEYLSQADIACHAAKENGRNRLEIYKVSRQESQQMEKEIRWVQKIRRALDGDGFVLLYQPLLRIDTGWTDHFEVLLRLKADDGTLVSPDAFLPAANRFGLMLDIDYWVIEHAIQSLAQHQTPRNHINYSINLSASVFESEKFSRHVASMFTKYDVAPESIIFEITEQTAVRFAAESDQHIEKLRQLGCRFAIDDFGKGYSSFSYLRQLSVDYLKIDGSFVIGLENDEVNQTLVRVMGEVARAVRMETIAECVETEATLELLADLGITYAQGHFISRPAEAPIEVDLLLSRKPAASRRTA